MIAAVIILSLLVSILSLYLMSCIIHIRKIQKELDDISKEQSTQNNDIRILAIHVRDLTAAHNELVNVINGTAKSNTKQKNKKYVNTPYYGPVGEA